MTTPNPNVVKRTYFPALELTKQTGENEEARLYWGIRNGYPRLSLSLKQPIVSPAERTFDFKNLIIAPFTPITFSIFLKQFHEVLMDEPNTSRTVNCYNNKFENGVRTDELYLQGIITIGKDSNGVMYIHLCDESTNNGVDAVKFELTIDKRYHRFFKNSKEIDNKVILSKLFATEYLKELAKQYGKISEDTGHMSKEIIKDGSSE